MSTGRALSAHRATRRRAGARPRVAPVAVFALALAEAASAASPPAPGAASAAGRADAVASGRTDAPGGLLNRDALRRCLYEQLRLSAETDSLAEATRALEDERAGIAASGAALKAEAATLDRADRAAVDAYNERAEARNAAIARHETAVAKVGERIRAVEPARQAWSRECADRPYRQDDRDAIGSGR